MTADTKHFIIVFDDEIGACWPMGWDADCLGAVSAMTDGTVALFTSRADARTAIRISTAYAKLCKAQGKPANDDFLDAIAAVKIIEAKRAP
jgi:hypothetical protein